MSVVEAAVKLSVGPLYLAGRRRGCSEVDVAMDVNLDVMDDKQSHACYAFSSSHVPDALDAHTRPGFVSAEGASWPVLPKQMTRRPSDAHGLGGKDIDGELYSSRMLADSS